MTTQRLHLSTFLILAALLCVASTSEAQLEPRFYPPGSTTVAAYYVPHLDITVAADLDTPRNVRHPPRVFAFDYPTALAHIAVLNGHNDQGIAYLDVTTWRLPKAILHDP